MAQVVEAGRVENRAAARKVLAAGALWDAWIERDVELGSGVITDCGNAAIAELSVRLGCSKTVAQTFAEIGIDLWLRLPLTRAAFEAGDLDLARVRAICRETTGLSPAAVEDLEAGIVAAARQFSPGPLGAEIERLILLHCPDEAVEQRRTVQAWQRGVVNRRGRGCSTVEVTVSPEEGQAVMQLVAEFTRTVCAQDPRSAREKMVDAVLALMHGEPYLACRCERPDCDAEGAAAVPGRRAPLTQITMDVATLLGLASSPAYLHGHGPIDPELARELASDGTWQAMLTELVELAEELGLLDRDADSADSADEGSDSADRGGTDPGTSDADAADADGPDPGSADTDSAAAGRTANGEGGGAAIDPGGAGGRAHTSSAHINPTGSCPSGSDQPDVTRGDCTGSPSRGAADTAVAEADSSGLDAECGDTASTGADDDGAQVPDAEGRAASTDTDVDADADTHSVDAAGGRSDHDDPHVTDGAAQNIGAAQNGGAATGGGPVTGGVSTGGGAEHGRDAATGVDHESGDSARGDDESPPRVPTVVRPDHPTPDAPQPDTPQPDTSAASLRFAARSFLARGGRRSAGAIPALDPAEMPAYVQQPPPTSVGTMAEAILAAVRANPALAQGEFRDGHGGLLVPPPGALTYRPDAATAALVRARDRHCRFPGCHRPAAQCQLDHITEYLVRNPLTGGWTIVSNLQCLCAFHHQLKTLGFWRVVPLGDPRHTSHALLWTSVFGTTAVTLPSGAIGTADLTSPRPKVTGCRGSSALAFELEPEHDPPPF